MSMRLNNAFPQKAIITAVQDQKTAQAYIPLADFETGYIESTVTLHPEMVGWEAIVIFANGDRNQGVIVGVIPE
ncbi:hypothetical protein ACFCP7_10430 [Paenibacillus elgii]